MAVAYRFTAEGYFRVRENGALDSGYVDKEFEAFSITITALTLGITFGISLTLNILTIYKYKRSQTNIISSEDISAKLIVYSVLLTAIQCVRFGYNRMRFIFIHNPSIISVVLSIYSYVTAAHAIIASVGLLILSRKTRQIYCDYYFSPFKRFEPGMIFHTSQTQVHPV
uniref:Uncharacterized protein n=1 Tax=Panagrolaimus davidi TaxID=227884 RepID=A0A914Q6Y2_9BILA